MSAHQVISFEPDGPVAFPVTVMPRRGAPLAALAALVVCWCAVRVTALWLMSVDGPPMLATVPGRASAEAVMTAASAELRPAARSAALVTPRLASFAKAAGPPLEISLSRTSDAAMRMVYTPPARDRVPAAMPATAGRLEAVAGRTEDHRAVGLFPLPPPASLPDGAGADPRSRWSADVWVLWRPGENTPASSGAATPLLGGSQAGAVMRYALAPGSGHRPQAYLRVAGTPEGRDRAELAAGLQVRPVRDVPVVLHAEARIRRESDGVRVRPAIFATAGLDRKVAGAVRLRTWSQGGYVAGDDGGGFADGAATVERPVVKHGDVTLAAGGGTWASMQRDAGRLDIGPSVSAEIGTGKATLRLQADYRVRIAGDAAPASGPAITLAASL